MFKRDNRSHQHDEGLLNTWDLAQSVFQEVIKENWDGI
jgi:hypothetical protein